MRAMGFEPKRDEVRRMIQESDRVRAATLPHPTDGAVLSAPLARTGWLRRDLLRDISGGRSRYHPAPEARRHARDASARSRGDVSHRPPLASLGPPAALHSRGHRTTPQESAHGRRPPPPRKSHDSHVSYPSPSTVKHARSFRPLPARHRTSLECCSRGVTLHPSIRHTHPQEAVTAPSERRWLPAPRPALAGSQLGCRST